MRLTGLNAAADPVAVTVPKNIVSGVRVNIRSGSPTALSVAESVRLLGGNFSIAAELSGPGLRAPLHLPQQPLGPNDDPFVLVIPPQTQAGDYTLSNVRVAVNGAVALDVVPNRIPVTVIDQVLITSVTTRPLTLDEIRQKGIVLDSNAYLGFEFTLGLSLDSKATQFTFPVVFDKRGVALPQPALPPLDPERAQMPPQTTIVPMLLKPAADQPEATVQLPNGEIAEVRIPSVLVIPGNTGYLKQHFSAKLFVANGAPGTANLIVHDVVGRIRLPKGADTIPGTSDDPLSLPDTTNGLQSSSQPVRAAGADGKPGTADDVGTFAPGEQGIAEFLIRGEKEGFHTIDFDVEAMLQGLVTGAVKVTGTGQGAVLVRNPYFDMTFSAPAVVRQGERFTLFVTVNNISQSLANAVTVTLDAGRMGGAHLVAGATQTIDTLAPRDSRTLQFQFQSDRTGSLVATYLNFETQNGTTGNLKFTLGIGERGVPLSPDTLVLPAATSFVPQDVLSATMRVLGQAWSVTNAPSGSLPSGVIRTSKEVVTKKALALAEAGLRISLGQPQHDAVRDLLFDLYGGSPLDPGFDQILRTTSAGTELARAIGVALQQTSETSGGAADYERQVAQIAASGEDFITFGIGNATGAPVTVSVSDSHDRNSASDATAATLSTTGEITGAVIVPFGTTPAASRMGLIASPGGGPYKIEMTGTGTGTVNLSVTVPDGNGAFIHGAASSVPITAGGKYSLGLDPRSAFVLKIDADGNGTYEGSMPLTSQTLYAQGPRLVSATVIGPETLAGAAPFGFSTAVLFDRVVDAASAANVKNYTIAKNSVLSARRQLSGRLVFLNLEQPEGPYVATQLAIAPIADGRLITGPAATVALHSRLIEAGAVVTGRVLNGDGTPVRNVVIAYAQNPELTCAPPLEDITGLTQIRTDDNGRYEFRYVRQDPCGMPFQISTTDPSTGAVRTLSTSVRVAGEQIVLDIALFGRGSVTGTVKTLTGAPVGGAEVLAVSQTDPQSSGGARTDTDGRYRIDNIIVGPITVHAVLGNSLGRSSGRIDRAGTAAVVNLTLDGGTVSARGVVRKVQGSVVTAIPSQQVVYNIQTGDGRFIPIALATTDTNGNYSFAGMPTGVYQIDAALNSRDRGSATGIAAAGDVVIKDIAIVIGGDGYGTVRGAVKFPDGAIAPGVIVSIDDRGVLSNADGTFELSNIIVRPAQSYRIMAKSRDELRAGMTSVLISQPNQLVTNVVIILSGIGSAEFTLLDANRNPVSDQEVALLGECGNPCGCVAIKTDFAGKVRFEGLPLGTAIVRATQVAGNFIDQAQATATLQSDGATAFAVLQFTGSGTVTGTVLKPDGSPALGADVTLTAKEFHEDFCGLVDGIAQRVRTDAAGKFRFTAVNVGNVSVNVSHPFYATNVGARGTLSRNGDSVDFALRLVNTISGVLSGTVYLPDGTTPAGAGVEVTTVGPLPEVTVTTNENGHFEFAKIFPEGTYNVTARDAVTGGVRREQIYLRASQDITRDIRLKGRGTVNVNVVNGAGQVVTTSAFVRLQETDYPNRIYEAALEAANNGVATFTNVFEGPLTATASDSLARGGRSSSVLASPGATLDMTVAMTTTGTVKGHFFRADGVTPIPFGGVRLVVNGSTIGQATTNGTDDIGAFSFAYVPAGPVRIEAQDPQTARSGVAAGSLGSEGEIVTLDVKAQGLGRVQGMVTSNGSAQAGAQVVVDSGQYHASTLTDATGHYLVDGVPEGWVIATASLPGNFLTGSNSGLLSGEANTLTLDVALRDSGRISGRILKADGVSAAPLSFVSAQVGGSGGATLSTTSDTLGNFAFDRVPTGLATLNASVLGGIDKAMTIADVVANTTANITMTLNGVGSITGRALDSGGQPVAGDVTVIGSGSFPYSFTVQSQSDGNFALPQVLSGPFTATLRARSGEFFLYGTKTGTVPAGDTTNITVQVQPSGTVTALVVRSNGTTPAVGSNVTLQLDPNRGTVSLQAGNDGRFTARGVPLGPFTVNVNDPITTGLARIHGNLPNNGDTTDLGTITLDDKPLTALSFSPADGTTGVATNAPVSVTFSNALQSAFGVSILDGTSAIGAAATLSTDAKTITLLGTWPDSKELTVSVSSSVTDIFGRHPLTVATSKFRTVDLSPPRVAIVIPVNGAIQVESSAAITITYNEPITGSAEVTLSGPGGSTAGSSAATSPTVITFTPSAALAINGTYILNVNGAIDLSGNTQTTAFTSTFATTDTIPPVVTIASPSTAWVRTARPQIQINNSDATSGVNASAGMLRIDGNVVPASVSGPNLFYTPPADLAEGAHGISASVPDRAGNSGIANGTFSIDTAAPTAPTISGIGEGATLRGQMTFSATATDATSGVAKIELLVDGSVFSTLAPPAFSVNYDTNALAEGPHAFTARATDVAGNVSPLSAPLGAVVDNRPLTIAFNTPAQNTAVRDAVSVSATPSEPVSRIEFSVAGQTSSDTTSPYEATFTLTGASEGPQTVTATGYALSGETAQAVRTVVIDRTPPTAPDASRISAEPPQNGSSLVFAFSGAVEPAANVEITNTTHAATAVVKAGNDGTFSVYIPGQIDDILSIVAIDSVGNRSGATTIPVRSTPSLPPSEGSTTLRYDGNLVDRVGLNTLTPDGNLDAVFTLSLSIGDGVIRTISYVDLNGPTQSRTTRTLQTVLGIAQDAGSALLNRTNGSIDFPVTGGTTLTLFVSDLGLIQDGGTYTVKAVFTDGSQFIDTFYIVPKDDRALVAHSADVSASPATVAVPIGGGAGTTTLTITNIRDIEGTIVPDGAKIALSATDMASKDPLGNAIRSAGGAITDGDPASNNPNFRIFTISGGTVRATYSSAPVTPPAKSGSDAVVQIQAADAAGNVLGTEAISTIDILLRTSTDPAIVHATPAALYADRNDRRAHLRIEVRDTAGLPLADGTKVVVTAQNAAGTLGCCYFGGSAGGQILGGTQSTQNSQWRVFTVTGGTIEADYSSSGLTANVGEVKSAIIIVNPADANGNRTTTEIMGSGAVFLVGAGKSEVSVSPETVPYVFPLPSPVQVDVHHAKDTRAHLLPDGSNLLVSANSAATILGCCYVGSFGGTIVDGTPSSSGGGFKFFPLLRGAFRATYSIQGVGQVSSGEVQTANIQVSQGDAGGARFDARNVGLAQVKILGPLNARGSVSPSTIFGDGNLFTTTVHFDHVIDTFGNPLPEGSKVVASAANAAAIAGCCYLGSIGGQILNGDVSPTAGWKTFAITNGGIDITYGNQGIASAPGETKTANVVLAQSGANGERLSLMALGLVPVSIIGTTSAQATASPSAFFSDGVDYRSTITISNVVDSRGVPVPDGTLVGVSAINAAAIAGCCYLGSAGGQILGDRIATNNTNFKLFPVTNGQVVVQYSSQGVVTNDQEKIASIAVVSANSSGAVLSIQALGTVSVRLLPPSSATVLTDPINVTALAPAVSSQITVKDIKSTDGVPLPDGSKVALSVVNAASISGCCYVGSIGGTITPAGTTAGDGTPSPNNGNFQSYTIAGGQVRAVYDGPNIPAGVGEVKTATVQVVAADRNGAVLNNRALGTATVRINGVTSTTASGPASIKIGATATITFSNIKDAAGNPVPDGTPVAVTVANSATISGCCYNGSGGGTITNGTLSPNANFRWFSVSNGSVTVEYSTQNIGGTMPITVRVQVVPALRDGTPIGGFTLGGGMWPFTVTN